MQTASLTAPGLLPPRQPTAAFMGSHPAHLIALRFGARLSRVGPGTVATLWSWIASAALQQWLEPAVLGQLIALALPLGWWACTVTLLVLAFWMQWT